MNKYDSIFAELREISAKYDIQIVTAKQHPRPPGSRSAPLPDGAIIFIDYPSMLLPVREPLDVFNESVDGILAEHLVQIAELEEATWWALNGVWNTEMKLAVKENYDRKFGRNGYDASST